MLAFYRDTLGCKWAVFILEGGYEPLVGCVRFEFEGGTALELFSETRHGLHNVLPFPRNNAIVVAFMVQDIDATYSELMAKGVEFPKGIGEKEWERCVHFRDPGG